MKKNIKKIVIFLLIAIGIVVLLGTYIYFHDNLRFKFEYEMYNFFSYSNGKKIITKIDSDNKVKYLSNDIVETLKSKTAIFYFGYPDCPWCRNAIPVLIDTANEEKAGIIYYIDVHSVLNEEIRKDLFAFLGSTLEKDDAGNPRLYVPAVYFMKNGEIKSYHVSTVESYHNPYLGMNQEQKEELSDIYQEGINLMKEESE